MDHGYIDKYDLVEQYLMGKLADEESAQFEEHYADCQQCFDRLKITKNFIQDLRSPAARQALHNYTPKPTRTYFAQLPSSKILALVAGFLLVITITIAILSATFIQRLRSEVSQARNEAMEWQQNYEEAQQVASATGKRLEEREQELNEQLHVLEDKLQDKQKSDGQSEKSGLWIQPEVNPLIFSLNSVRRDNLNQSTAVNEITLPDSSVGFLISIGLESDVSYEDYRVVIVDQRNMTVMNRNGFKPNSRNALSMGLNSRLFRPGNYLLKVDGITKDGDSTLLGNYPFRITKGR